MPKSVRLCETGAADVLKLEDIPQREPKVGRGRIRVQAIGLNRADVMFRTGQYLEQPRFSVVAWNRSGRTHRCPRTGCLQCQIGDRVSIASGQSDRRCLSGVNLGGYGSQRPPAQ